MSPSVIIVRPHRNTTHIDAGYCYRQSCVICLSVGRSVCHTVVSPAKNAEPIEMPFGLWTRMDPRNHVLDGGSEVVRDVAMATSLGLNLL